MKNETAAAYLRWAAEGARLFKRCTRRQYMAIVVTWDGRVIGTGRNGAPAGLPNCTDGGCPRGMTAPGAVAHGSSYGVGGPGQCVAVHAEVNALMYTSPDERNGGTLIVNGPPCWNCAVVVAGSGIDRLVCKTDPAYADWPEVLAFLQKKVEVTEFVPCEWDTCLDIAKDRVRTWEPDGTEQVFALCQDHSIQMGGLCPDNIQIEERLW